MALFDKQRPGGLLYLLCLPREALRELLEHHLQDQLSADLEQTYLLFGSPPYTFSRGEPAPLREFGKLTTSQKKRRAVYDSLPASYQEIVLAYLPKGKLFGPYLDSAGRYYKFETETTLTALIPKGKKEDIEFPNVGDTLTLRHVNSKNEVRTLIVIDVIPRTQNTCTVECTEGV